MVNRRTKRRIQRRKTKKGGAASQNTKPASQNTKTPRKSRGIKLVPVSVDDKLSSIREVFHRRLSEDPLPKNIKQFEISEITIPITFSKLKTIWTNASGNNVSLSIDFYEQPPYFYKKIMFDVTDVGIHECTHQIVLFLNEIQINSKASQLMDQCSFITPIPNGYYFSVTPEGIVTFIIRMEYVNLSNTSDVTKEDFPAIKK